MANLQHRLDKFVQERKDIHEKMRPIKEKMKPFQDQLKPLSKRLVQV